MWFDWKRAFWPGGVRPLAGSRCWGQQIQQAQLAPADLGFIPTLQIRSQMKLLTLIFTDTFSLFRLFLSRFSAQPRNIAKVVSQVHAFQETAFPYSHDRPLQAYLRWRISQFAACDAHLLAPEGDSHLQQSSESQTRKIQEKLRRVKASFH